MSELKAFSSERIYCAVEQVEREAGDIDRLHLDDNWFFLKSEADKVIAEKDKEIAELQKQVHDYAQGLYVIQAMAEKEIRHQKRKRCLAMAEMCRTNAVLADLLSPKRTSRKFICWKNRYEKFLKLADKFKEAK